MDEKMQSIMEKLEKYRVRTEDDEDNYISRNQIYSKNKIIK